MKTISTNLFALTLSVLASGCNMTSSQWDAARVCGRNPSDPMCGYHQRQAREDVESARERDLAGKDLKNRIANDRKRDQLEGELREASARRQEATRDKWKMEKAAARATDRVALAASYPGIAWVDGIWCKGSGATKSENLFRISDPNTLRRVMAYVDGKAPVVYPAQDYAIRSKEGIVELWGPLGSPNPMILRLLQSPGRGLRLIYVNLQAGSSDRNIPFSGTEIPRRSHKPGTPIGDLYSAC